MSKSDFIRVLLNEGKLAKQIEKFKYEGKTIYRSEIMRVQKQVEVNDGNPMKKSTPKTEVDLVLFTEDVFSKIKKANLISDLIEIENTLSIKFDVVKYPKINFSISKDEILDLKRKKIIDGAGNFNSNTEIKDPITRLFYSIIWKQGDLQKAKHIVNGICHDPESKTEQEDALVFYQFGKHLANKKDEPIIDQHTIRAFLVYKNINKEDEIAKARMLSSVSSKESVVITQYKNWLTSNELTLSLKKSPDYVYYIDRILFGLGKMLKVSKTKPRQA